MLIKIGSALIDPEEVVAILPVLGERAFEYESAPNIRMDFRSGGSVWVDATMDEAEAALIDAGVVTDLTAGNDDDLIPEMDINDLRKLNELWDDGFKYIARDKNGKLFAYLRKPEYDGFYWNIPNDLPGQNATNVDGRFDFISQDDKEPTSIGRLMEFLSRF